MSIQLKQEKQSILFTTDQDTMDVKVIYTPKELKTFFDTFYQLALKIWPDLQLKPVTSMGNDYFEYYDRKYDANGYISLSKLNAREIRLSIERPYKEVPYLYKINKAKTQTLLYDMNAILTKEG